MATYRLTDQAGLLLVRNESGELVYHTNAGPEIPRLSEEQRAHYMNLGLIEEVPPQ
jgi:hypothetical protein